MRCATAPRRASSVRNRPFHARSRLRGLHLALTQVEPSLTIGQRVVSLAGEHRNLIRRGFTEHTGELPVHGVPATEAKWSTWKRYCGAAGISMGRAISVLRTMWNASSWPSPARSLRSIPPACRDPDPSRPLLSTCRHRATCCVCVWFPRGSVRKARSWSMALSWPRWSWLACSLVPSASVSGIDHHLGGFSSITSSSSAAGTSTSCAAGCTSDSPPPW